MGFHCSSFNLLSGMTLSTKVPFFIGVALFVLIVFTILYMVKRIIED